VEEAHQNLLGVEAVEGVEEVHHLLMLVVVEEVEEHLSLVREVEQEGDCWLPEEEEQVGSLEAAVVELKKLVPWEAEEEEEPQARGDYRPVEGEGEEEQAHG
jgi:PHP family Zn ribbon phosphoesterase